MSVFTEQMMKHKKFHSPSEGVKIKEGFVVVCKLE